MIRAPFGAWTAPPRAINAVDEEVRRQRVLEPGRRAHGNTAADWDCWGKGVSVERCGELYLKEIRAKGKGIVLMHDIHDKTVDMVKSVIVPALIAEGYHFARVDRPPRSSARSASPTARSRRLAQCASATLGRTVDENVCVQARSDQKWYRCVTASGPLRRAGDRACTQRIGL